MVLVTLSNSKCTKNVIKYYRYALSFLKDMEKTCVSLANIAPLIRIHHLSASVQILCLPRIPLRCFCL